jgi:hypothetical protein
LIEFKKIASRFEEKKIFFFFSVVELVGKIEIVSSNDKKKYI